MVNRNMFKIFPIAIEDITVSDKIFGLNIISLKGKKVRKDLDQVKTEYMHDPKKYSDSKLVGSCGG